MVRDNGVIGFRPCRVMMSFVGFITSVQVSDPRTFATHPAFNNKLSRESYTSVENVNSISGSSVIVSAGSHQTPPPPQRGSEVLSPRDRGRTSGGSTIHDVGK